MSATPTDTDSNFVRTTDGPGTSTASYPTAITTFITETQSNSVVQVITATSYSGAATTSYAAQNSKASIPVAPIAGGAAGGVFLALAIVIGWIWWGKCIKRKTLKERREAVARLQVRENTRRNASSSALTSLPYSYPSSRREKKVSFVSTPSSVASTLRGTVLQSKEDALSEKTLQANSEPPPPKGLINAHKPVRPSPLGRINSRNEQAPLLPTNTPTPFRPTTPPCQAATGATNPFLTQNVRQQPSSPQSSPSSPTPSVQPFLKRTVAKEVTHKASAASSMSAYSTASGEERQKRVSTSLIMAALGHMDPRRSWLGNYLPLNRRSRANDDLEQSRLSTASAASVDSHPDAGEPIGYAYGGEESAEN